MDRITTLCNALDRAARHYYHSGTSIFSDDQYDAMVEELRTLDPENRRLKEIGSPVPEDSSLPKVQNRASTNSLAKVEDKAELKEWYAKSGGPLMVELKADGATVILYYIDGVLDQVLTRGGDNGIGQDITKNAIKFKGVKPILVDPAGSRILFTGAVRGEALMLTADYAKLDPTMSGNVRNIGTGTVLRTDGSNADLITFLAFNYECLSGGLQPSSQFIYKRDLELTAELTPSIYECEPDTEWEKIATLKDWGFTTMTYELCANLDEAIAYWDQIAATRNQLSHAIDGIVFKVNDCSVAKSLGISSGKPNSEVVLKFQAPGADTTVIGVTMTVGHDGAQIPTARLKPVIIDKTTVSNAQLNNWDIISALDVAIGDIVRVVKAKDIIPNLTHVVKRVYRCPECGFSGSLEDQKSHHS